MPCFCYLKRYFQAEAEGFLAGGESAYGGEPKSAEEVRFELTRTFLPCGFSRAVPSTTRPLFQMYNKSIISLFEHYLKNVNIVDFYFLL